MGRKTLVTVQLRGTMPRGNHLFIVATYDIARADGKPCKSGEVSMPILAGDDLFVIENLFRDQIKKAIDADPDTGDNPVIQLTTGEEL